MTRRFQFSLWALLALVWAVAVACALWIKLPITVRMAIISGGVWIFFCLPELLPPLGDRPSQSGARHTIKW
ncbi:MAG TPA: hypothetical protein VF306_11975, partial [Pirellulales bacterium]